MCSPTSLGCPVSSCICFNCPSPISVNHHPSFKVQLKALLLQHPLQNPKSLLFSGNITNIPFGLYQQLWILGILFLISRKRNKHRKVTRLGHGLPVGQNVFLCLKMNLSLLLVHSPNLFSSHYHHLRSLFDIRSIASLLS